MHCEYLGRFDQLHRVCIQRTRGVSCVSRRTLAERMARRKQKTRAKLQVQLVNVSLCNVSPLSRISSVRRIVCSSRLPTLASGKSKIEKAVHTEFRKAYHRVGLGLNSGHDTSTGTCVSILVELSGRSAPCHSRMGLEKCAA